MANPRDFSFLLPVELAQILGRPVSVLRSRLDEAHAAVARPHSVDGSTTSPNLTDAKHHLWLVTGLNDPDVCVQVFHDSIKGTGAEHRTGRFSELLPWIEERQRAGCGVYIVVNRTDGKGRKAKNIVRAMVAFVDLDGTPLPENCPVDTDLIVETSPGRFHLYWTLKPTEDLNAWSALQAQLAGFYKGDPSVTDASRVARLAGFWHLKNPKEPFQSRIVEYISHGGRTNSVDEMMRAHPGDFAKPRARRDGGRSEEPEGGWDSDEAIARATQWLKGEAKVAVEGNGGDRLTFATACQLRDFGVSKEAALELMLELWNERCSPPWDFDQLEVKVDNAYRYAQGDAGSWRSAKDDFANSGGRRKLSRHRNLGRRRHG